MNKVVLDASCLLALIKNETGAEIIEKLLGSIIMSSVNVSEVAATLMKAGMLETECKDSIEPFVNSIIAFDTEQSYITASLKTKTQHKGLSLGDRACISLGLSTGYTIYTADKAWDGLDLGCDIRMIR
jgi:ribonuclease VapC